MRKLVSLLILLSAVLSAQNQAQNPTAITTRLFKDANSNLAYVCNAQQIRPNASSVKTSDSSLTSIVVSSDTATITTASAHGAWVGMEVTISGATANTGLNASYKIATVPSSTTYTVATSGVSNSTNTESTLVVSTFNPLLTQAVWQIQVLTYDSSNFLEGTYYANGLSDYVLACSNRANYGAGN